MSQLTRIENQFASKLAKEEASPAVTRIIFEACNKIYDILVHSSSVSECGLKMVYFTVGTIRSMFTSSLGAPAMELPCWFPKKYCISRYGGHMTFYLYSHNAAVGA